MGTSLRWISFLGGVSYRPRPRAVTRLKPVADVPHDWQRDLDAARKRPIEPESALDLMRAVLSGAMNDVRKGRPLRRRNALAWVAGDDAEMIRTFGLLSQSSRRIAPDLSRLVGVPNYSFAFICESIGVDAEWARAQIERNGVASFVKAPHRVFHRKPSIKRARRSPTSKASPDEPVRAVGGA